MLFSKMVFNTLQHFFYLERLYCKYNQFAVCYCLTVIVSYIHSHVRKRMKGSYISFRNDNICGFGKAAFHQPFSNGCSEIATTDDGYFLIHESALYLVI